MNIGLLFVPSKDKDYLAGQKDRLKIIQADLSEIGFRSIIIDIKNSEEILNSIYQNHIDLTLSISDEIENREGMNQNIHDTLERSQTPYIGSSSDSLRLCRSKNSLKQVFLRERIPTPEFLGIQRTSNPLYLTAKYKKLTQYPYIVKPCSEGNSNGISAQSICFSAEDVMDQVKKNLKLYTEVMVEQYMGLNGTFREFTAALIGTPPNALIFPVEIQFKDPTVHRPITTEDKDQHRTIAVPIKENELYKKVIDLARKAFMAAGVRDYARCDLILSDGNFYVLEVNGQPMIPDLWFEACCKSGSLNRRQYLYAIIFSSLVRWDKYGKIIPIPDTLLEALPKNAIKILKI